MYEPKRLSLVGTDWQEGIDFDRLRKGRLERIREQMKKHGLGVLLLFKGINIRYASGVWDLGWKGYIYARYCILTENGEPVLFETPGHDMDYVKLNCPWMDGRIKHAIIWKNSGSAETVMLKRFGEQVKKFLDDEGVVKEKVGVDMLDMGSGKVLRELGINIVDGTQAIADARMIKTKDELEILKIACAITDAMFYKAREEWVKPGIRVREAGGKIADFYLTHGCQWIGTAVISGTNTNPYLRSTPDYDNIFRNGDMIIIDSGAPTYLGYYADYTRAWVCGAKPTKEQKELYKECYSSLYDAIKRVRPGGTTKDIAEVFPEDVDDYLKSPSLMNFGHGIGIGNHDEPPWISRAYSLDYPQEIKQNMYLAIETYAGKPGGKQGVRLEENLVVTDTGYEIFSLFPFEDEMLE